MAITRSSAFEIADDVRTGTRSAADVVEATLASIALQNPVLNAFTDVTAERARAAALRIDAARAKGHALGPLAGVPFAVKNLFDVAGITTLAGAKINRSYAVADTDALLVQRLEAAGAVLVGALNMGEYAYDFTGENLHYGPARNPLDTSRMTGGSSSGSAGAVSGGLVPFALGSDTNGSIRVPASMCGIFGLKPTYGRLPRTGTFPFVHSLDHLGVLARNTSDLATTYDAMQGHDAGDAACSMREIEPVAAKLASIAGRWKIARAGGYFVEGATAEALGALETVADALGVRDTIEIAHAKAARAAAYLITTTEGAALHLGRLRTRAADFEPIVRDRLISGAMVPASAVVRAQKVRAVFRDLMLSKLQSHDAIIALAAPCVAPTIGQQMLDLGYAQVPLRANIGLYTQPISFVGLPVVAVPVAMSPLPVAVQIITAPWREDIGLAIARDLERLGVAAAAQPGA